jgi:hypothetical protein
MRHHPALLLLLTAAMAGVSCGSGAGAASRPATSTATATATASASPDPCAVASPSARAPVGATQALSVISIRVLADIPVSAGVLKLGVVSCVTVGVGQTVSIEIRARVPPLPAETRTGAQLLAGITVSPAVASSASVPQAGQYIVLFTARESGTTALTYLPATCMLPPGVC